MRKSLCIETDQLILYAQGISDSKEKIEKHLLTCPLCMQRLTGTIQSLYHDDLSECQPFPENEAETIVQLNHQYSDIRKHDFIKRIKHAIRYIKQGINNQFHHFIIKGPVKYHWQALEPQLIAYRSQSFSETLDYFHHKEKIDDIQIQFYFEKTSKNCFNMQLSIYSKKQFPVVRVTLKQNNSSKISRLVGASGEWIKNLNFGSYLLYIEENSIQKGQFLLNIQSDMILFDKKQKHVTRKTD
jgi:hypothetical protein